MDLRLEKGVGGMCNGGLFAVETLHVKWVCCW